MKKPEMMKMTAMKRTAAALFTAVSMAMAMMSGAVLAEEASDQGAEEQVQETADQSAEETAQDTEGLVGFLTEKAGQLSYLLEDDSPLLGLFEEEGPLSGFVPEGVDVKEVAKMLQGELDEDSEFMQSARGAAENADQFIEEVSEQLSDENSELYQLVSLFNENAEQYAEDLQQQLSDKGSALYQEISAAAEGLMNEDGSVNEEAVSEIISLIIGGAYEDVDPFGDFVYPGEEVYTACREYVKELNKDFMEEGDVQFVAPCVVQNAILDDGTVRQFGMFSQTNYAEDGSDLKLVSGATDVFLFTLEENEDGTYTVIDTERTEDGETYRDSLVRLCDEMGVTEEQFYEDTEWIKMSELLNYVTYMEEHPEIEHMEYMAEMLTSEEMQKKLDEAIGM